MNKLNKIKSVIILVTVVLTSVVFTSCNSDDDSSDAPSIVGVWLTTGSNTEEFTNNVSDGTSPNTINNDNFSRLTFNTDNTFIDYSSDSFVDSSNGQTIIETSTDPGTYTISGNSLFITYDGDTDIEEVEFSLSTNILTTIFTEEYVDSNNDNKRFSTTTTFSRQ